MSYQRRTGSGLIDDSVGELYSYLQNDKKFSNPFHKQYFGEARDLQLNATYSPAAGPVDTDYRLPNAKSSDTGSSIVVVPSKLGMIYVHTTDTDTIFDSWNVYPIAPSMSPVRFVVTAEGRWIQVGGPMRRIWFEWNDTNLRQFHDPIVGSDVANYAVDIQSWKRHNWIRIDVDSDPSVGDWHSGGVLLPIKREPPVEDVKVTADIRAKQLGYSNTRSGSGVFAKLDNAGTSLVMAEYNGATAANTTFRFRRVIAGASSIVSAGGISPNPGNFSYRGVHILLECWGDFYRYGMVAMTTTGQIDIQALGRAGIAVGTENDSDDTEAYFRNIKVELLA